MLSNFHFKETVAQVEVFWKSRHTTTLCIFSSLAKRGHRHHVQKYVEPKI